MKEDSYQPISCDLHSQYELAIMHKNNLQLKYKSENDVAVTSIIKPIDIQTKNKAEYLIADTTEIKNLYIRLDHILEMRILDNN